MRKLALLCILALLCGCTPKLQVRAVPAVEITLPEFEETAPTEAETAPPEPVKEAVKETLPAQTPPAPERTACTFSISCAALVRNPEVLDEAKRELVPPSGWLLAPCEVEFEEGETVFDLLRRVCREHGILMEFTMSPVYETAYVEGIGNLYEFDGGPQSGWVYSVNGVTPNYGCSSYDTKPGDTVCWEYKIG